MTPFEFISLALSVASAGPGLLAAFVQYRRRNKWEDLRIQLLAIRHMPPRAVVDDGEWIAKRLEDASYLLEGLKPVLAVRLMLASSIVIGSFGVILYNIPGDASLGIGQEISIPELSGLVGAEGLIEPADIGAAGLLLVTVIYLLPAIFISTVSKGEQKFLENVAILNIAFYHIAVEPSLNVFNDEMEGCPEWRRAILRYEREKKKIRRKIRVALRKINHKLITRKGTRNTS